MITKLLPKKLVPIPRSWIFGREFSVPVPRNWRRKLIKNKLESKIARFLPEYRTAFGTGAEACTELCTCCCKNCTNKTFEADQDSQPQVTISGSGCSCDSGTHNGSYNYSSYSSPSPPRQSEPGCFSWTGATTCDYQPAFGTKATMAVTLCCCSSPISCAGCHCIDPAGEEVGQTACTDKWVIIVGTSVLDNISVISNDQSGSPTLTHCVPVDDITVNAGGDFVGGPFTIQLYDAFGAKKCTLQVEFG